MKPKRPTVFWGNERVTHGGIIAEQRAATLERMAGEELVLLVQDTTSFDFSHHPATQGLGRLENAHCRGFLAHSTLAVSSAGVPLGILEQQVWVRSDETVGKRAQRHETAFEDKESYKWVGGLPADQVGQTWVTVGDREAHIFEFLDAVLTQQGQFVVRAAQGRSWTEDGVEVFAQMRQQPAQSCYTLDLKRHPEREARPAEVELRFDTLTLHRPARATCERPAIALQVIEVIEPNPPEGEAAVHWLLLTSLPVAQVAEAQQIVTWYTYRWLIERLHYVLKSGCKLEARQLREAQRLERLLAVYTLVAWRLLWLTYQARLTPDAPCTLALTTPEWHALYAFIQRSPKPSPTVPTLHQAVRWIAQLGGFLGRKGDGDPGVKVLWRGWSRLQDITATWIITHPPKKDVGNV